MNDENVGTDSNADRRVECRVCKEDNVDVCNLEKGGGIAAARDSASGLKKRHCQRGAAHGVRSAEEYGHGQ